MPTIMDVAARAAVSMKTVSRVLNNEPHVRPAVRQRVELAVRELGYRPNLAARQLAGTRSFIIAYPFNNPSPNYITDILMGAAEFCRDHGYHLVSEPVDLNPDAKTVIQRMLRTLKPDGVILTPPLCDTPRIIEQFEQSGVPVVRIAGGRELYGRSIILDERAVSRQMVEHLVSLGHQRIGFIHPHPEHILAQARYLGYLDGLAVAGIEPRNELVRQGLFDLASGVTAGEELLSLPMPPTAIFAANDDMALGVLQVAHRRGLSVPGDVAIAGFDDSPSSSIAWPPLTTVRQPVRTLGCVAARMLIEEDFETPDLSCALIIRESTASKID